MRKDIVLPALALAGGAAGLLLRIWQRVQALDPVTQLYNAGAPSSLALLALAIVMAVLSLALCRGGREISAPEKAFLCPYPAYMTLMTAAAMAFLLAAAAGMPQFMQELQAWQLDSEYHALPAALFLSQLGCVAAAVGSLTLGRSNYRLLNGPQTRIWAALPAYGALPWLVAQYQNYSRDPDLTHSYVPILACVCLLLALYYQAACYFARPRFGRCIFFAVMGVFFGMTSLADGQTPFYTLACAAFVLCALATLTALCRCRFGPPPPKRLLEDKTHEDDSQAQA